MAPVLLFGLLAIFAVHVPALALDWYHALPWLDIPMHIAGGLWVGICFVYFFVIKKQAIASRDTVSYFALGLGFVALVGVLWEFHEFLLDTVLFEKYPPLEAPGFVLADSLSDLANDLLGGAVALLFAKTKGKS